MARRQTESGAKMEKGSQTLQPRETSLITMSFDVDFMGSTHQFILFPFTSAYCINSRYLLLGNAKKSWENNIIMSELQTLSAGLKLFMEANHVLRAHFQILIKKRPKSTF